MSLTKVSYSMIAGECINAVDFGASTSSSDNSVAIQAALDAAAAGSTRDVQLPGGIFLIGTMLQIPEGVVLRGQGTTAAFAGGAEGTPTRIVKKASMTTYGIKVNGKRAGLENLGVFAEAGATGGGIWVANNFQLLRNVSSNGHAGVGIKLGAEAGEYRNTNMFRFENIEVSYNGSHGLYIDDEFLVYPVADSNAGCIINCSARENGGDGIRVGNCFGNTFINMLTEQNDGYGMNLTNEAVKHSVVGGDFDEGNTLGQFENDGQFNTLIGMTQSGFGGSSPNMNYLGYASATFTHPISAGEAATVTKVSYAGVGELLTLNGQSSNATGVGVGIAFGTPNGGDGNAAIKTGLISVNQSATFNTTRMDFSQAATGTLTTNYRMTTASFTPLTDGTALLGANGLKWSEVWAANGTIQTSDERLKQDIADLTEAERQVAQAIKGLIKTYRMKSAFEKKGDGARIHVGVIAQEVAQAFRDAGLDPNRYSLFCYDEWEDEYEPEVKYRTKLDEKGDPVVDMDGREEVEAYETGEQILVRAAGNQYAIRYDQLLAFVISAL